MRLFAMRINDITKRNAASDESLQEQYESLVKKYGIAENELNSIVEKIESIKVARINAEKFVAELERINEPLTEFDNEIFCHLVKKIEIYGKTDVKVMFRGYDGM